MRIQVNMFLANLRNDIQSLYAYGTSCINCDINDEIEYKCFYFEMLAC